MFHWKSRIHDRVLAWSALVLACVGSLLQLLSSLWGWGEWRIGVIGISFLGVAIVAFLGSMGPIPKRARVAVILYIVAIVIFQFTPILVPRSEYVLYSDLIVLVPLTAGTREFFIALGLRGGDTLIDG